MAGSGWGWLVAGGGWMVGGWLVAGGMWLVESVLARLGVGVRLVVGGWMVVCSLCLASEFKS